MRNELIKFVRDKATFPHGGVLHHDASLNDAMAITDIDFTDTLRDNPPQYRVGQKFWLWLYYILDR